MATMATTHGLTVLTNSCVKPPLNPKTGLSTTMHEQRRAYRTYDENGAMDDYTADDGRHRRKDNTWPSGLAGQEPAVDFEAVSRDFSNMNDDEFYLKLTQLKNEHKKTLEMYENLYRQKVALKQSGKEISEHIRYADKFETAPISEMNGDFDKIADVDPKAATFHDFSYSATTTKPPTGRPPRSPGQGLSTVPVPKRSSSPPRQAKSLTRSLDEEVWKKIMSQRRSSEDIDLEENDDRLEATQSDIYDPRDISATMTKIDDMWENFSIQDYAPSSTRQRPSSAMQTRREKEDKVKEWRHRITIPKPFKMTTREANKEKKKSQTQLEHEDEMFLRQKEEEIECQKKFKAAPVPAHVYLPLYDEIMEKNEARRRYVKEYSEDLLRSQEKPFNFLRREDDKKHRRTCSAPSRDKSKKPGYTFKARPVPSYIFDTSIDNEIQEEEEYRKIRIKMRSEELLQAASLPPNMDAREKAKEMRNKEKIMRSKKKDKFRPKINHEVPNYDELYKQFQKELARRKHGKEATVTKPFTLNTCNIGSSKSKILKDIERDEETLRENRWPYKSSRASPRPSRLGLMSSSLDSLPAKSTNAADLRTSVVRKQFTTLTKREREELEKDRKRRIREMKLRKSIAERAAIADSPSIDEKTQERLKKFREEERARLEDYQKELDEMRNRVESRPLLFEQQSEKNAAKSAEKQFSAKLRSVGLDEDFIQTRSSRTVSLTDDVDDYEDDFDDTDVKTGVQNETYDAES